MFCQLIAGNKRIKKNCFVTGIRRKTGMAIGRELYILIFIANKFYGYRLQNPVIQINFA